MFICGCGHSYNLFPTDLFTNLEPQNQETSEIDVVRERCATDFEAPICEMVGRIFFSANARILRLGPIGFF